MSLYVYKKAPPVANQPQPPGSSMPIPLPPPATSRLKRLAPTVLITLGSILIANVAWPMLHYQIFISPQITRAELITPININQTAYITPQAQAQPIDQTPTAPVLGKEIDYTKVSNWFPHQDSAPIQESNITHYTISIPKVNIEDAVVEIGGEDLSENLIHYAGTANPGDLGSPVIFGHSVLRQFYNPDKTNPRRYISIFSKIMTLKDGDEIFVDFDGIRYRYVVKDKFEVKPEDVYILQQRYNSSDLKLVTCVPEGTYLRRGVVVATLTDLNQTTTNPPELE